MTESEGRSPFEVIGEVTYKLGGPQPAFPREEREAPQPTGEVRVGPFVIGDWTDAEETPLQAVVRLNNEVIEKNAELEAEKGRRVRMAELVEVADLRARRAASDLLAFRQQVRSKAIEVAQQESWCRDGLNEALRDLGLPEHTSRFRVPLTVTATQTIWVEVEADDEDDAIERVDSDDVDEQLDSHDWEIKDWDKTEWSSIEPVDVEW